MAYGQAFQSESALRIPQVSLVSQVQVAAQERLRQVALEGKEAVISFAPGTPLAEVEKQMILRTLRTQKGNRTHTARILGIGLRTLQRKLKKYEIHDPDCVI